MASGWKFSVTVPSWTQTTLEGDELVVVSLSSPFLLGEVAGFTCGLGWKYLSHICLRSILHRLARADL